MNLFKLWMRLPKALTGSEERGGERRERKRGEEEALKTSALLVSNQATEIEQLLLVIVTMREFRIDKY